VGLTHYGSFPRGTNVPEERRLNAQFHPSARLSAGPGQPDCRGVEVFVIIIPPIVALLIGAWAVLAPRPLDPKVARAQLEDHITWLEQRMAHGRAGNWDEQMMANLQAQLDEAHRQRSRLVAA